MTTLSATRCALYLFVCWAAAVDVHAQNLLQNPSFEDPVNNNPLVKNTQTYTEPSMIGTFWTVGGMAGQVDVFQCPGIKELNGANYCPAGDGAQYLSLSTQASKATVSQRVSTKQGGRYRLRFKVAAARRPSVTPTVRVEACCDDMGQPLSFKETSPPVSTAPGSLTWQDEEFYFRAASGPTTITLSDISFQPENASFIDNVVLEEAPSRFEINRNVMFMGLIVLGFALWYFIIRKRAA
jgi:hypothetical protein